MQKIILVLIALLVVPFTIAATYVPTGAQDFNVYSDVTPALDDYVYSTVRLNDSNKGQDFRCLTMLFANNSGNFIHVQSNPPHVNPTTLGVINPNARMSTSPEALGYFSVVNGVGNVYYRSKDVVAYNEFLYVILCSSDNVSLVYEEVIYPEYKEFGRSLPSRGVWFAMSENSGTIVFVGAVVLVLLMFILYRFMK